MPHFVLSRSIGLLVMVWVLSLEAHAPGTQAGAQFGPSGHASPERLATVLKRVIELSRRAPAPGEQPGLQACEIPAGDAREERGCQRCRLSGAGWRATFEFQPDLTRGVCTLQQSELRFAAAEPALFEALAQTASLQLRQPARRGELRDADWVVGSSSHRSKHIWEHAQGHAYLYADQSESASQPTGVVFLWRQAGLLHKRGQDQSHERYWYIEFEPEILTRACRVAGDRDCAPAVASLEPLKDNSGIERRLRANLLRLSALSPRSPAYPALLFWIDRLARGRIGPGLTARGVETLNLKYPELRALKAGFVMSHYGPQLADGLIWRLAEQYPASYWGQRAFLQLTAASWEQREGCMAGTEAAQAVIDRSEDFLKRYPQAELGFEIRLELARAYDTWWSLSRPKSSRFIREPAQARPGAENARQQALDLYRRLERERPAVWLKEQVFLLERGLDTAQRRYACSIC